MQTLKSRRQPVSGSALPTRAGHAYPKPTRPTHRRVRRLLLLFLRRRETVGSPDTAFLIAVTLASGGETVEIPFDLLNCMYQAGFAQASGFDPVIFRDAADFLHVHCMYRRKESSKWLAVGF